MLSFQRQTIVFFIKNIAKHGYYHSKMSNLNHLNQADYSKAVLTQKLNIPEDVGSTLRDSAELENPFTSHIDHIHYDSVLLTHQDGGSCKGI